MTDFKELLEEAITKAEYVDEGGSEVQEELNIARDAVLTEYNALHAKLDKAKKALKKLADKSRYANLAKTARLYWGDDGDYDYPPDYAARELAELEQE